MTAELEDYGKIMRPGPAGERRSFEGSRLDVMPFNQRAVKVYERAGLVRTETARRMPAVGGMILRRWG